MGRIDDLLASSKELREIYELVERAFYDSNDFAHDFSHVRRVLENALEIGEKEKASLEEVILAALLHDIKRPEEYRTGIDHAKEGSSFAFDLLLQKGYSIKTSAAVANAIRDHRYSSLREPEDVTGKILQDADRLDAIGAIAIARVFTFAGKTGRPLHTTEEPHSSYNGFSESAINHFHEKILKIKPESFWTSTGRRLSRDRYDFTVAFVERFMLEWR
jgi:uncharacterized protein